jgi:hypothetical protein
MMDHWPEVLERVRVVRWLITHYEVVHRRGEVWLLKRRPGAWPPPPPAETDRGRRAGQ